LEHLRAVHATYGQVVGTTQAARREESPAVGECRMVLTEALRDYVLQVSAAMRRRKKPLASEIAERLLRPLADWRTPGAAKTQPKGPAAPTAPVGGDGQAKGG